MCKVNENSAKAKIIKNTAKIIEIGCFLHPTELYAYKPEGL